MVRTPFYDYYIARTLEALPQEDKFVPVYASSNSKIYPFRVAAAGFALRSPYLKGAVLCDEAGALSSVYQEGNQQARALKRAVGVGFKLLLTAHRHLQSGLGGVSHPQRGGKTVLYIGDQRQHQSFRTAYPGEVKDSLREKALRGAGKRRRDVGCDEMGGFEKANLKTNEIKRQKNLYLLLLYFLYSYKIFCVVNYRRVISCREPKK